MSGYIYLSIFLVFYVNALKCLITYKRVFHAPEGRNCSLYCQYQSCVEKLSFYSKNYTKLINVRLKIKAEILDFEDRWRILLEASDVSDVWLTVHRNSAWIRKTN